MTYREFSNSFQMMVDLLITTIVKAQREEFGVMFEQLDAMKGLPWAKIAWATGELNETIKLLQAERQRQALSLSALESATGISRSRLSEFESQKRGIPSIASLERIAAALGMKLYIALVREDCPKEQIANEPARSAAEAAQDPGASNRPRRGRGEGPGFIPLCT